MAYPQISSHELKAIFRIRYGNATGTAFLLRASGGICMVSAAHVLSGARTGDSVHLQAKTGWQAYRISDFVASDIYDVCVFSLETLRVADHFSATPGAEILLGAQLLFVGFPHDLVSLAPGGNFTVPLVRGALFSGTIDERGCQLLILDGFNNPGYSGSPVYARHVSGKAALLGVISGYRWERPSQGKVFQRDEHGTESEVPNLYVKANSGMIQAVGRHNVEDIASQLNTYIQEYTE